jgi:kynurenine formamidase
VIDGYHRREEATMRIVDLSMTVEECDSAPFAPEEKYFKLKPIINWEDRGFVSNIVQMTVHAGTHVDSPHHFFREKPSIEQLPLEPMRAGDLFRWIEAGKLSVRISKTFSLAEAADAHRELESRRSSGKILLIP